VAIGWQSASGFEYCSLLLLPRSLNFLSSGRGETVDTADLSALLLGKPRLSGWFVAALSQMHYAGSGLEQHPHGDITGVSFGGAARFGAQNLG
jgi:hypothetical protein